MKIGIDASRISAQNRTGVEWYSFYLIKNLIDIDHQNQYFLYSPYNAPADLGTLPANFTWQKLNWPPKKGWTKFRLTWHLLFNKPDILFIPAYVLPPIKNCAQAITWHDFAYEQWPESYSAKQVAILKKGWQRALVKADLIFVPSESVKQYAIDKYPEVTNKIVVTHLGVDPKVFYKRPESEVSQLKEKFNITKSYVFFVGRFEAKKNIVNLVKAFLAFNQKNNSSYQLVLAGRPGFGYEQVKDLIVEHSTEIIIVENFSRNDLAVLYSGARCLFFPTLAEGFGLPVLEALACNCPVAASDLSVIKEVGDKPILYVGSDIDSMVIGLEEIIVNHHVPPIELMNEQVKKFAWQKTAQLTLDALNRLKF